MKSLSVLKLPFVLPEKVFHLLKEKPYFIWLDSRTAKNSRYSLMACEPFLVFRSKGKKVSLTENKTSKIIAGEPLEILGELLDRYEMPNTSFFAPGALGCFSYDLGRQIEKIPDTASDNLNMPDICLGFYDTVLLFDRREKNIRLISADISGMKDRKPGISIKNIANALNHAENPRKEKKDFFRIDKISSNISCGEYLQAVRKVKNHIARGDVYQINFSRRIEADGIFPADSLYLKIRDINPTSFSGFFDAGDFRILSNSPELFVKKNGSRISTLPMKGTRPRGKNRKEDAFYRNELILSEKDKAELVMIVDLERNDLGKVCRYGSVRVRKLRNLEIYRTILQTTALVEGEIREGLGQIDLLKAVFPGGSITGAPKIRAMEIIEELEPCKRAFYTGSMGYLGFNGNMELNILIRTILLKNSRLYYPVGGGIVWDSVPEDEYEETQTKAKALFMTLGYENEKFLSF